MFLLNNSAKYNPVLLLSSLDREFTEEGDALINHGPTNSGQKDAVVFYIEEYGELCITIPNTHFTKNDQLNL
jgi:hypothetical protein